MKQNKNSCLDVSSIDAHDSDKVLYDKGLALKDKNLKFLVH